MKLEDHLPPRRYAGPLTERDARMIREQVLRTPFLHWPRLSSEWGISEPTLRGLAREAARLRPH